MRRLMTKRFKNNKKMQLRSRNRTNPKRIKTMIVVMHSQSRRIQAKSATIQDGKQMTKSWKIPNDLNIISVFRLNYYKHCFKYIK
jgi:hypothetical protein